MKSRRIKFDVRENALSSRLYVPRLAFQSIPAQSAESRAVMQDDPSRQSASSSKESSTGPPNNAAPTAATRGETRYDNHLLNVQQAAYFLAVSVSTLYGWVWQRRVLFIKIGKALRFDRRDLETFIEANKHAITDSASIPHGR
jgi:excisionase family DNA binding protein